VCLSPLTLHPHTSDTGGEYVSTRGEYPNTPIRAGVLGSRVRPNRTDVLARGGMLGFRVYSGEKWHEVAQITTRRDSPRLLSLDCYVRV